MASHWAQLRKFATAYIRLHEIIMASQIDLRRIEELALNSSAPPAQLLYDGWLLRPMPGQAKRARSVNAVYRSILPLAEKVAYCERLYCEHRLPLIFRITPFSEPPTLDAELERLGYPQFDHTAVEVASIEPETLQSGPTEVLPLSAWVEAVGELRGSPPEHRASHLARLQASPLSHRPLVIRHEGRVVATGLTIVEDGWAGLFDIVTDKAARRQGYGRQLVDALLLAAWDLGARRAYLQVTVDNTPARALYARLGFQERYQYWYRGHSD
jgi:ribosomal protein S18 acetylase RimI-like enzyme